MKLNFIFRLGLVVLTAIILNGTNLMAQPGQRQNSGQKGNQCNCIGVIDLTLDQREQMITARESFFTDTKEIRQKVASNNRSLMLLDSDSEDYQEQKQTIQANIGQLRSKIVQRRAVLDEEIKSFLTEDQKEIYDQNCSVAVCHAQNMQKAQQRMEARLSQKQQSQGQFRGRRMNGRRGQQMMNPGNCPRFNSTRANCPWWQNSPSPSDSNDQGES